MKSDARAKNSLSVVSKCPEEAHDTPSALRVQSGGRLVQEQKKLRLRCELDSDRQSLPLFATQCPNNGIGILLQTTHQETFLDIGLLLCRGNILRLTKNGREKDCLADGRSGLVRIQLLTVTGLGLKVCREGLTVHEHIPSNDADRRALSEDVQERCLFFKHGGFGLVRSVNKGGRTFPAPDSPISAVNFPGMT